MMKKKDWILFGSVIFFSLAMFFLMKVAGDTPGNYIVIRKDGELYGTYDLHKEQVIEIEQGEFYNKIHIRGGMAYMEEANCPDGYCERQQEIHLEKQTIICLPHKLVVEVLQTGEQDEVMIDAITN